MLNLKQETKMRTTDKQETAQTRTWDTVEFNGKEYKVRVIKDKDDNELFIGNDDLLNAIHPGDWDEKNSGFNPDCPEKAEKVYNDIFFFTDDTTFNYSDEDLRADMAEELPDYFNDDDFWEEDI